MGWCSGRLGKESDREPALGTAQDAAGRSSARPLRERSRTRPAACLGARTRRPGRHRLCGSAHALVSECRGSGCWRRLVWLARVPRILAFAVLAPQLFRFPLARAQAILEPRRSGQPWQPDAVEGLLAQVDVVLGARPTIGRRDCLARGATRYRFLRRAGVDITLQFGIGRIDGVPTAHCWLVRDGEPWLETRDPRDSFVPTYAIHG